MSYVITATFGRNIGDTPMSSELWESLKREVLAATNVRARLSDFIEAHEGFGHFEGMKEESFKVSIIRDGEPMGDFWRQDLIRKLQQIAKKYMQKCFALTLGESELIPAL